MAGKKVLICESVVPFTSGGAELLVRGLAQAVREAGYEVDTVSIPFSWKTPDRIVKSCLVWRLLELSEREMGPVDLVVATKFPTYLVDNPRKVAWVFHQHRSLYEFEGTIYDDLKGQPQAEDYREMLRRLDRRFLLECRKVFTISANVTKRMSRYSQVNSEVLYHPPPLAGHYQSGEYGNDVLVVGRLEPPKRIDLAIRAMRFVKNRRALLRITGRGLLDEPLRELAEKEGVANRVRFEGFVTDEELIELYANAGCVVYTPFDEDYGYVTLEALASRRPVVVTDDSGGPLEFVKENESGRVVPATPEAVASAIDGLLADRGKARRFGDDGYERVRDISWDGVVERLITPFVR